MPTTVDWEMLRATAIRAGNKAYAPYSRYPVGAAGLTDKGEIVFGCNVENVSYGLGLCAEVALVASLVAGGGGRVTAVAVAGPTGPGLMPCGRCRQVLYEHGGPELLVDHPDGPRRLGDLLPDAFGPADLARRGESDR